MTLVLTLLGTYAAFCLIVWLAQRHLLFFPGGTPLRTPADAGMEYEEVQLLTADGMPLSAWWVPAAVPDGGPRGAVLVFHGNAGNIEGRIPLARELSGLGLDVLLFDYRGYGTSGGRPSEKGLYLDGEAAHDWLTARMRERGIAPEKLVYFGESLGGAVAIELAQRRAPRELAAIVTQSTFTSVPDVARSAYWFLPVDLLARDRFLTIDKLGHLTVPLLVAHGRADEIIPFTHAQRIVAAAPRAELLELGGGHNDGGVLHSPESRAGLRAFLDSSLR